jgi:hypothetical protein
MYPAWLVLAPVELAYPAVAREDIPRSWRKRGRSVYADAAMIPRPLSIVDQMDTSLEGKSVPKGKAL